MSATATGFTGTWTSHKGLCIDHLRFDRLCQHMGMALDPFYFTTTRCEAPWMGVPVVTWPGTRTRLAWVCPCLHG